MASTDESSLLSKLESSDFLPIYSLFFDYLRPFSDIKKSPKEDVTLVRSLAKKYLSFINQTLHILSSRLCNPKGKDQKLIAELFDVYRLCLDCLDLLSSQLSCKPYAIALHRLRMITCLSTCGMYKDGEREGFRVLEKLRSLKFKGKSADAEFAEVFVKIVAVIIKCVANAKSKDARLYKEVLGLVEETGHWFKVLDVNTYEKLHKELVTHLVGCTQCLIEVRMYTTEALVREYCVVTLKQCELSSMREQFCKVSRRICSSLFSLPKDSHPFIIEVLICVLELIACKCKVKIDNGATEFAEILSYCASKCRNLGAIFCATLAGCIEDRGSGFAEVPVPTDLILRLYAAGLHLSSYCIKYNGGDLTRPSGAKDELAIKVLLNNEDRLCDLSVLLGKLRSYFSVWGNDNCVSSGVECEDSVSRICLQPDPYHYPAETCTQKKRQGYLLSYLDVLVDPNHEASRTCEKTKRGALMLSYLNALEFLCEPLAELVISQKKEIIAEIEAASFYPQICSIQDAFYQFSDVFLFLHSCTSERDANGTNHYAAVSFVAVAALMLSTKTRYKTKKSEHLIKHIVSSAAVQPEVLKYLFRSLLNVGKVLNQNKLVKEASKALKLCCLASWTCVVLLCKMFVHKLPRFNDLSEVAVVDFSNEACARTAYVLDVLHRGGSPKINKVILESLQNWSAAADCFEKLPAPTPLVKQWVKIQLNLFKNIDFGDGAPTLCCLLSSSVRLSKRALCTILEQELQEYEEKEFSGPKFCRTMQMKIMNVLLKVVYVTKDSLLRKSRVLLRKARLLRAGGAEGLKECIKFLSEAISIMNEVYGETCSSPSLPCDQLAVAYCLRALCTQEAEPNSKQIIQDIDAGLNIWLSITDPEDCKMLSGNTMTLLYNIVDLLSLKGCTDLHYNIYKMMIRFLKWKNVPLERCLTILWESRRLTHARCRSPVTDAFKMILSEHCGELAKSFEFWISCFKGCRSLEIGFKNRLLFLFSKLPHGSYKSESSFEPLITADDVKEIASQLLAEVCPLPRHMFLAGHLYYDLCERLISNGRLFEALSYAKEAHRLRSLLNQKMFFGKQAEKCDEAGNTVHSLTRDLENFQVFGSVAIELWFSEAISLDIDGCYLSPWNVLQCYLESTLQVGILHELIGDGKMAETYLQWGKSISSSQYLPQFIILFSTILGKIYCKRQCWDLAVQELRGAKQILVERSMYFSCRKCRLMLEATVDQQLGDFCRSHFESVPGIVSAGRLLKNAEKLYNSAIEKLNFCDWKNPISCPDEVNSDSIFLGNNSTENVESSTAFPHSTSNQGKVEGKKCRKTKNGLQSLLKEQNAIPERCSRVTRSRSSQNPCVSNSIEAKAGHSKRSKGGKVSNVVNTVSLRESAEKTKSCITPEHEGTCICNEMKCLHCLPLEVIQSGLLDNFEHLQWESIRRRLLLKVLIGKGKWLSNHGQIHKAHEIMLQSISLLINRNTLCHKYSYGTQTFLLDLIGKEMPGDTFTIEHAAILYNISWLSLKSRHAKGTRNDCCDVSSIELQKIISWLALAFVLCREVPILFQKVSKLLSTLYILSATNKSSLPSCRKILSESHWAFFFHQASLGSSYNYQFLSNFRERCNTQHPHDGEGSGETGSFCIGTETCNLLRVAPVSFYDLEQLVKEFFMGLPCATVICISFLGDAYVSLLQELLPYPQQIHAWLLLSRLNSKSEPVVLLLPVNAVLEDENVDEASSSTSDSYNNENSGKIWHCPWGSSVADKLAPTFKVILEENFSLSSFSLQDTKENRALYWTSRKQLDHRLCRFLRNLEDSWLGPWKHILLGELRNCKRMDSILKKLSRDLKSKGKVDANKNLLRVLVGGLQHGLEGDECVAHLSSKKGCYIASTANPDGNRLASHLILEAVGELEKEDNIYREPTILVLDSALQMLPWENIPILRNQEVYRMPSVGSITAALERIYNDQEHVKRLDATFPLVDPLDAFYLLNPSGDLPTTQAIFENWFRDQNLEGKAGSAPTADELALALKSHDLFLYFGHGSGSQYISSKDILKLEKCAGTFLMGCSSGSMRLDSCYFPSGMPLNYLQAGSPVVIANLWEVTDKDIDRFGKVMLDAWMEERSHLPKVCDQCALVEEELKGNNKKKGCRTVSETRYADVRKNVCNHRPKLGSFMGKAREACYLPFLVGAAPVCYGVPTGIRRKKIL